MKRKAAKKKVGRPANTKRGRVAMRLTMESVDSAANRFDAMFPEFEGTSLHAKVEYALKYFAEHAKLIDLRILRKRVGG